MADTVRIIAIGGTIGVLVAGAFAAPAFFQTALADEPVKIASSAFADMFAKPFNPKSLVKFDITYGPSVSTEVRHSVTISKISYGQREYVSIVTTPSGTYSSDALTSPNVRYPGVDVTRKVRWHANWDDRTFAGAFAGGIWTSVTSGSITTLTYSPAPAARS
jgi:hypothetical protein